MFEEIVCLEDKVCGTQIMSKIYRSLSDTFPDLPDARLILTWMLYRFNLDHKVGQLYSGPFPICMPSWRRLTQVIEPEMRRNDDDIADEFAFLQIIDMNETDYQSIRQHIFREAMQYGNLEYMKTTLQ